MRSKAGMTGLLLSLIGMIIGCGSIDGSKEKDLRGDKRRLEARVGELEKQVNEREQRIEEKTKELEQTNARIEELKSVSELDLDDVAAMKRNLAKLEEEKRTIEAELNELHNGSGTGATLAKLRAELKEARERLANQDQFIATLMAPMKGLWTIGLESRMADAGGCELFLQVDGLSYQKALVCPGKDGADRKASYEAGRFVDIVKVPANFESSETFDTNRQVTAQTALTSCKEGYAAPLSFVKWTKGAEDFLAAAFPKDQVIDGLHGGDAGHATQDCAAILSRPKRPGLESAVLACQLFTADRDALQKRQDLGCFQGEANALTWQKQELASAE